MSRSKQDRMKDEIRTRAETDLAFFIQLIHPGRALGDIHKRVCSWWERHDRKSHQLLLLPRDHGKSAMLGYRCAQAIVKNPAIRILYISSTSNLAVKQLKFIKDILTSDVVRFYWPDLINIEEAKREKWTETEISVDHPQRKAEFIRDPTVFAAGLTTNVVGLHCDIAALDDVVVFDNAYTEEGRIKVEQQYSLLASVESSDSVEWAVGTRYDPRDLYATLIDKTIDADPDDEESQPEKLYEVMQEQVEDRGDGTGTFLWPRQTNKDGKLFGFDSKILRRKKAQYLNKLQFRAQYYNDPNDPEDANISNFQYYDRKNIIKRDGRWHFKEQRLNVFAAIDFAYSLSRRSDYTALVVIGVDSKQNYYVLDIERYKTEDIADYFRSILRMYQKWDFRKIRMEMTTAQKAIVKDLKQNYIRTHGLALSIDEHLPTRNDGDKEERIRAVLEARYDNGQVWHFQGGLCSLLEEELILRKPPHDDIKDALANAIDIAVPPSAMSSPQVYRPSEMPMFHSKFGGVA